MTGGKASRLKLKAQIYLGEHIAIGPGKADLLDAVRDTGSIAAAGRRLGISYRRTRDMIDTLNRCWGSPVVETARGGSSGGGSRLTQRGNEVLAAYRALEAALGQAAEGPVAALLGMLEEFGPDRQD